MVGAGSTREAVVGWHRGWLLWAGPVSLPVPGRFSDQAGSQTEGMAALLGGLSGNSWLFCSRGEYCLFIYVAVLGLSCITWSL